ncbi:MAG: TRAP transporter substrate-binding protein DctP [Alphaproteobacteria bacterium]
MKKHMLLGALAVLAVGAAPAAQAESFRLLNSWDANFPATKVITVPYMDAVKAASNGAITITMSGPETVPAFEQFQPLQSGAFQLLMSHGAYHYGAFGMGLAGDAFKSDSAARRTTGVFQALDEAYQKKGLKLIAMPMHKEGYQFIMRKGLPADGDLKGMKVRTTPGYLAIINAFGGVPVTLPPGEVYSALQKGVVDGAAWPTIGVLSFRWYEVANTLVRPTFGNSTYLLFMNLEAFKKLDAAKQKIMLDAGEKIERDAQATFTKLTQDEEKELLAKGMKIARFADKHAAQIEKLLADGVWGLVEKKEGDAGKAFRAFVLSKGMTN